MNDYLSEILTFICLDTHTNTLLSFICALCPTTCQTLSLPLGGHIMQLHFQTERQTWMKMIGTDNFA